MMTALDVSIFKKDLFAMLKVQGLIIIPGIIAILGGCVFAANSLALDITFVSRIALMGCVPILLAGIFYPLLTSHPDKKRLFIVGWFVLATFFNLWWEVPQVLFIDVFREANQNLSLEKLPYFIAWWGYTTSDLDYFNTTGFFILTEIAFWIVNLLSFVGIYYIVKSQELKAMFWFAICGALQIYNVACIFIPHGYIVEHGQNIAPDSILAIAAFWIMNLMWILASAAVVILSYQRIQDLTNEKV